MYNIYIYIDRVATKATDVDVILFQVGRLEDSRTVSSQKTAWINYDTNKRKLHVQTLVSVTETYVIPRQGPYYQTDKSRAFFKLAFCHARALHSDEMDYCAADSLGTRWPASTSTTPSCDTPRRMLTRRRFMTRAARK